MTRSRGWASRWARRAVSASATCPVTRSATASTWVRSRSVQSDRERTHVEAVALLVTGHVAEAETALRAHLEAHPRDLVIAQRLYFVWFWQGRFPEMLALTERLLKVAGDMETGSGGFLLGLHAFALEEADRLPDAARVAQAAIGRNPRD